MSIIRLSQLFFPVVLCSAFGQTPSGEHFEVASIKPAPPLSMEAITSGQPRNGAFVNPARASFLGLSLRELIATAYRVRTFQVIGPGWIDDQRYDIHAKLPLGADVGSTPEMLRALLTDRFSLTLHTDSSKKEFPVYALVLGGDPRRRPPRKQDYRDSGGARLSPVTMDNYAKMLDRAVDRPVVNLTGLDGEYMISLEAVVRASLAHAMIVLSERLTATPGKEALAAALARDAPRTEAFRIVRLQGLDLEPRKIPITLLVIDHLEKAPVEN